MIKAVIFDMDGLMLDTEKLSQKYYKKACLHYGYDVSDSFLASMIGKTKTDNHKAALDYFGQDFPVNKIRKKRTEYINKCFEHNGVPKKKGLNELLDYCKSCELKLAVATSTNRSSAEYLLSETDIIDYFDTIVCGDEVSKGKPNPEIYITASSKLGIPAEKCAVLEDSKYGILAANSANMHPIFVPDLVPEDDEIKKNASAKCLSLDLAIPIIQDWINS